MSSATPAAARSPHRATARAARGLVVFILERLGEDSAEPLYIRLYRHLREAIMSGALAPGAPLPAGRTLAEDLGASRNTVEAALAQLRAEGFVVRTVGSGTRVARDLPVAPRSPARFHIRNAPPALPVRGQESLSRRGREVLAADHLIASRPGFTFAPCIPDAQALPTAGWRQILSRHGRRWSGVDTLPPDAAGFRPLRESVAAYVAGARGVHCDWRQVVIVGSVQQALGLIARLLLDPGDRVWLEEPGYPGARAAFASFGAELIPVPVDREGMDVERAVTQAPGARLAYVTPSHQYPLGVTLSLGRRMALIEWAGRHDAWIVEDDYDSEFRYVGRPLAAIQGLDTHGRVIYAGTFSKVLWPSLRLAYLVLPRGLAEIVARAQDASGGAPSTFLQAAVAELMETGGFGTHLRRARALFRERRDALLEALHEHLRGAFEVGPADAGLHVVAHLPVTADDRAISARAASVRLDLPPLSAYFLEPARDRGLLIHFAGTPVPRIRAGVQALATLLSRDTAGASATPTRAARA